MTFCVWVDDKRCKDIEAPDHATAMMVAERVLYREARTLEVFRAQFPEALVRSRLAQVANIAKAV